MKYFIVYYCLTITFTNPCPSSKLIDDFSLENVAYCDCLKKTRKQIIDYNIDKKFKSIDSAFTFYNKLKLKNIDSVRILIY